MSEVFERASVSLMLADFAVADQLGKLQMVGGGLQIVGRDHATGSSAAFALVVSLVFPPELFNEQYVVRGRAGGHVGGSGRTGRAAAGPSSNVMRFGQTLQVEEPNFRGSRGPPARAAAPVPRGAVLQHRPAAAGRSGAGLAGPHRRRLPAGLDAAVLRAGPTGAAGARMRLATWNVNSIRVRLDRLANWLERSDVDVLAIQETKIDDDKFPVDAVRPHLGYEVAHHGISQWNGVAVISRVGLEDVQTRLPGHAGLGRPAGRRGQGDRSHLRRRRVWSLYVPNGRAIDDPHYDYKLAWLAALRGSRHRRTGRRPDRADRAVRRLQHRAHRRRRLGPAVFVGSTHVTPPERAAFTKPRRRRLHRRGAAVHPGPGRLYLLGLPATPVPRREGMRIDFVLASPALADRVTGAWIDREERKGKGRPTTPR